MDPMIVYAMRRLGRAVATSIGLAVVVALVTRGIGSGCADASCAHAAGLRAALDWLGGALRLDLGQTADNQPVASAIAAALPATLLLVSLALLIELVCGWGGGVLLAFADLKDGPGEGPTTLPRSRLQRRRATVGAALRRVARGVGRALAALAEVGQGVPTFWFGGLLVALFSLALGVFPPGGIVDATLPAFGSAEWAAALGTQPFTVLGDLLAHLILPALTLAAAELATDVRLVRAALPAELRAQHTRVARAAGLSERRLVRRAGRPVFALVVGGAAAGAPLAASALVLVEYLFGWPGLGQLAYHAARTGDVATLSALALLFGLAVIAVSLVADLLAAWADPRLRGASGKAA